jgi:hypothetical protein
VSLHQILETLIRHTNFRTEAEQYEAMELLDNSIDHDEPTDTSMARTNWRPAPPTDASGQPITVPTAMTSAQADELIALMKSQQATVPSAGPSTPIDTAPEPPPEPAPLPPTVKPDDVPPGVT